MEYGKKAGLFDGRICDGYRGKLIDYKNKGDLVSYFYRMSLNKTQSMFEWKGLPDTIQQRDMERLIQTNGYGVFLECKGDYYCIYGSLGGLYNFNYMPTRAIVHNPYIDGVDGYYRIFYGYDMKLEYPKNNVPPKADCVVIANDAMYYGLDPLINIYANRLADTAISRHMVTVLMRATNAMLAKDDNVKENIDSFFEKLEKGEYQAIFDEAGMPFKDGSVYTLPLSSNAGSSRMITELIEAEQYDKASFLNEIGLQANYNMKREAINSDESQLNDDATQPLVDQMLAQRQLACERIKKVFGLDISVDFSSVWKVKRQEREKALREENKTDPTSGQRSEDESNTDFGGDGSSVDDSSSDAGE